MNQLMTHSLIPAVLLLVLQSAIAPSAMAAGDSTPQHGKAEGMVIVAPERFHRDLTRFRAFRAAQRPAELVALEAIKKSTQGVDDPERLKRWLYKSWKDGFHASYFGEVRGEKNKSDPINFDRIDYRPELAVGRWPVDSDYEVGVVAEKTMAYERAVLAEKSPALRLAALVWVPGWIDARERMNHWAAGLPVGWKAARL